MSEPRRPAAFRIEPQAEAKPVREADQKRQAETARKPRALAKSDVAIVTPDEIDVFGGNDDRHRDQRTAAGGRPAPPLAPRRDFPRCARHAGHAGARPVDRPADPRPVLARRLAGLAGGRGRGDCGAVADRHPGPRIACPGAPRLGRKNPQARARRHRPRRPQGGARRGRRIVAVCRRQAGNGGRPPRARRPARRDHRRGESGPACGSRNPRAARCTGKGADPRCGQARLAGHCRQPARRWSTSPMSCSRQAG